MFVRLCRKLQSIVRQEVRFHNIPKGGQYRFGVGVAEVLPFIKKLSLADFDHFKKKVTFAREENGKDKRSVIIPLHNPIIIDGKTIQALRLKGVMPQVAEGNRVAAYKSGRGFSKRKLEVTAKDEITIRLNDQISEHAPWGTVRFSNLAREVETALWLGGEITEALLGFGFYEGIEFDKEPVGFAIYGMERKDDVRIFRDFVQHVRNNIGRLPQAEGLARHTGELLRKMHEKAFFHGAPHLGNFRKLTNDLARILDLDTAVKIESVPEEFRRAFLYLDCSRIINDYQREIWYEEIYDGEAEIERIQLTFFLPYFFWGYFRGDVSLPFVREMEQFVSQPPSIRKLLGTFGNLAEFGVGWRWGGTLTLIEPTIKLYATAANEKSKVNLLDFMDHSLFAKYYEALGQVSASLRTPD
jgi:hypothetical protein